MGRLISDILTESGLVDHLYEAGQAEILRPICGKPLDGKSLFRLKLIDEVKAEPHNILQEVIKKRRVKVQYFPLWTAEEPVECLLYYIESCKRDGIPLPPYLLEQARRSVPDIDMRRKRKMKKKVVAKNDEPLPQKKKKITIRNKGIVISENRISNSVNIEPTIIHTNTPPENQIPEQTIDHTMTDVPEQNMTGTENIASEQVVSEHIVSENIVSEQNVSEQIVSEQTFSENIVSEQSIYGSENVIPENILSDQPVPETPVLSEPPTETPPDNVTLSEQQQQQPQPQKSPSQTQQSPEQQQHKQTSQQEILENTIVEENVISEHPENDISKASETLPETSPVFDDFSKTDFFSEALADEIPQNTDPIPENNSQIVPVLTENHSDQQSETSSGSSFDADEFVSELMSRVKSSENRIVVPPFFFLNYSKPSSSTLPKNEKKPIVGKMLRNFKYDLKKWLTNLNKNCSESYDPVEAQQLFTQFRNKFNTAAATIQDVCCQNALKNLQRKIKNRVLYLQEKPEYNSYTAFAERFAAAKAAEKAFLEAEILKAEQRIEELARAAAMKDQASDKATDMEVEEEQNSVAEEVVIAAEKEAIADKPEDSVDLKAWMANQERVNSELQKTTQDLQKTTAEMKSWMVQQGETSSKIENLLTQLLAKKS